MAQRLPKLLREIASVIGNDQMLKLAKAVGGTRVYIPGAVGKEHWLTKIIGLQDARKLADHFSGHSFTKTERHIRSKGAFFYFPLAPRERQIDLGLSARQAALALGVTMRTIHRRRTAAREKRGR